VIKKQMKREYSSVISKEKIEYIKDKLREELKKGTEKQMLINFEDAKLLNDFLNKLKSELKKTENK
jgi:hypothetical protein